MMQAIIWDGSTEALMQIEEWMGDGPEADYTRDDIPITCITPHGDTRAQLGDIIVRLPEGGVQPCRCLRPNAAGESVVVVMSRAEKS